MKNYCRLALLALLCALSPFALGEGLDLDAFELKGSEVVPLERPDRDKSYAVGGALDISGVVVWAFDFKAHLAGFGIERLDNDATSGTSGPIMVALFVTAAPIVPGQPFSYYILARQYQSGLAYNYYRPDIIYAGAIESTPSNGTYYLHIGVFEKEAGCQATTGYCLDDFHTFGERLVVNNGVFSVVNAPAPTPVATKLAVEYHHAGFGHYFVTTDPAEIAGLDGGAYGGAFQRTGQQWKIWASGGAPDVCRFFTTPGTFGPKSSHFYTANASECNGLKQNPNWIYEKVVGKVQLTTGGTCPAGTQILYRLYNSGLTGAPNHRYTTSPTIRSQMIQEGFVPEDPNNACVPL